TYPRAHTRAGRPVEIASSFSDNVYKADSRAFSQWMKHIATIDKEEGTVIMIQIENEIGMLEDARDYSKEADVLFYAPVPQELLSYLQKNRATLHPQMLKKWESQGYKAKGSWEDVFGKDLYTDELFMAWSYAQYVEKLAQTARSIYNIPLFVNAAMNSRGRKPGEYPSAGPLAHLIDLWQCAAPHIDFLAPDIYDKGFSHWVAQYKLHNNPLFIPEVRIDDNNGVRAFYVLGEYDAIGLSPFSIEDGSDSPQAPLVQSYAKLNELMPLITKYQGKGVMNGLLFDMDNKERVLIHNDLKLTCRHYFTLPWDARATDGSQWSEGGGVVIRLAENEYLISGSGIVITFEQVGENKVEYTRVLGEDGFASVGSNVQQVETWKGNSRVGIGLVDEVNVSPDGTLVYKRRLNGDQNHQGRHVRIPIGQFSTLHVKLYKYK
ncbi:MAG: DUF5597 domain-containing protein, partial [Bacteroides sp.]|nr:DUF5597 domain-containing protein [Bacteroides sp.]